MVINRLTPALIVAYVALAVGGALISASFTAAYFRHVMSHTRFGAVQFSSGITGWQMLVFVLGNTAILIVTLGFGLPVVIHRNLRFLTANVLGSGVLDLATLQQSGQPVSRFGEGMFQVLDAGAGIV